MSIITFNRPYVTICSNSHVLITLYWPPVIMAWKMICLVFLSLCHLNKPVDEEVPVKMRNIQNNYLKFKKQLICQSSRRQSPSLICCSVWRPRPQLRARGSQRNWRATSARGSRENSPASLTSCSSGWRAPPTGWMISHKNTAKRQVIGASFWKIISLPAVWY